LTWGMNYSRMSSLLEVAPKAIGRSVETEHFVGATGMAFHTDVWSDAQKGDGEWELVWDSHSPNQKERAKK
jgi:hypothetical protein